VNQRPLKAGARVRVPYAVPFAAALGIWLARFNRERRFP
jgi:hypothetical protein